MVPSVPEADHEAALVRDTVTPAVHYLRFGFTPDQVAAFGAAGEGEVALVATHPEYSEQSVLAPEVHQELLGDLLGATKPLPIG
jgi:hypothetical protein